VSAGSEDDDVGVLVVEEDDEDLRPVNESQMVIVWDLGGVRLM